MEKSDIHTMFGRPIYGVKEATFKVAPFNPWGRKAERAFGVPFDRKSLEKEVTLEGRFGGKRVVFCGGRWSFLMNGS